MEYRIVYNYERYEFGLTLGLWIGWVLGRETDMRFESTVLSAGLNSIE
jgi:hypothetical protein